MNKEKRAERIATMLQSLSNEFVFKGGFNMFPQFCEEVLAAVLPELSDQGLKMVTSRIEAASSKHINFRAPYILHSGRRVKPEGAESEE